MASTEQKTASKVDLFQQELARYVARFDAENTPRDEDTEDDDTDDTDEPVSKQARIEPPEIEEMKDMLRDLLDTLSCTYETTECAMLAIHGAYYRLLRPGSGSNVSRDLLCNGGCAICGSEEVVEPDSESDGEEDDKASDKEDEDDDPPRICSDCKEAMPYVDMRDMEACEECGYVHDHVCHRVYGRQLSALVLFLHKNKAHLCYDQLTPLGQHFLSEALDLLGVHVTDEEDASEMHEFYNDHGCVPNGSYRDTMWFFSLPSGYNDDLRMRMLLTLASHPDVCPASLKDPAKACRLSGFCPMEKYDGAAPLKVVEDE